MSDTPTYDQLSALCAQVAAALEKAQFRLSQLDPAPEFKDAIDKEISDAGDALTAARNLSPDPVYAEAKNMLAACEKAILDAVADGLDPWFSEMQKVVNRARGEG